MKLTRTVKAGSYKVWDNGKAKSVFKYSWAFHPYKADDIYLKLTLELSPVKHVEFDSKTAPADFEDLAHVLLKLREKYAGMLFEGDGLSSIGFSFSDYDMLLEFINTASATMRANGIIAEPAISRLSGFPSYEYANNMLQHIYDSAVTLTDIENHMKLCAKLDIDSYDEILFKELPLTSDIKFDPNQDLNLDYLVKILMDKVESSKSKLESVGYDIDGLKSRLRETTCNSANISTEASSEETNMCTGFWV